jgi:hypothetical protein
MQKVGPEVQRVRLPVLRAAADRFLGSWRVLGSRKQGERNLLRVVDLIRGVTRYEKVFLLPLAGNQAIGEPITIERFVRDWGFKPTQLRKIALTLAAKGLIELRPAGIRINLPQDSSAYLVGDGRAAGWRRAHPPAVGHKRRKR